MNDAELLKVGKDYRLAYVQVIYHEQQRDRLLEQYREGLPALMGRLFVANFVATAFGNWSQRSQKLTHELTLDEPVWRDDVTAGIRQMDEAGLILSIANEDGQLSSVGERTTYNSLVIHEIKE